MVVSFLRAELVFLEKNERKVEKKGSRVIAHVKGARAKMAKLRIS